MAAIPPARELFMLGSAIENFDHSEPEISITCRVFGCGFEYPGAGTRSWDSLGPSQKTAVRGGRNINE